ncbi:hypothetical protein AB0K51_09220 [Kitasatospora sp. NPDC049285]|uniref:hypothetical protein n=1 Tax=Kitasatospora sp. NPDC049285 TaxID=3157096 RepID=UPI0034178044
MTGSESAAAATSLAAKLQLMLRLRRDPDGHIPSARDISRWTTEPGYLRPAVSHTAVNDLINGQNDNPTSATITALARALDAPAAWFLPGWNDLTALRVLSEHKAARDAVRLMDGLDVEDMTDVMCYVQAIRRKRGLPECVPEIPVPPAGIDQPRQGRPRRRLSLAEAAQRAADDLEGL